MCFLFNQAIARFLSRSLKDEQLFVGAYGPHGSDVTDSTRHLVDSMKNFRPRMIQTNATPLYLNTKYDQILQKFPGDEPYTAGQVNIKRLDVKKKGWYYISIF